MAGRALPDPAQVAQARAANRRHLFERADTKKLDQALLEVTEAAEVALLCASAGGALVGSPVSLHPPSGVHDVDGDTTPFRSRATRGGADPLAHSFERFFDAENQRLFQIAYVDGHLDYPHSLRVVNADGTDVRVLVVDDHSRSTLKQDVEWSPDGNLLAIAFDMAGIYTVRPDGSDFHLVIPGAYSPAWSPDGSLIAYSRTFENPDPGVWVANADGSNRRMISATGQVGPWNPGGSYQ